MRFRARMTDIGRVHSLTKTLTCISKVCRICVLKLGPSSIGFIYTDKAASGGTRLWCDLEQEDIFDEFRIEGKDERNEIFLEIITENFVRALKSAQNSQALKIKLTRKQTSCLTFEVSLPSLVSHTRNVVHDIPVGIIPSRFWEDYGKPDLPPYDIAVTMPNMKTLKNVIDRMKNVSGFVVIAANRSGQLTLEIETDLVNITTIFKHMDVETPNESSAEERPDVIRRDDRFEARVDIVKLHSLLNAQQSMPSKIICSICDEQCIHVVIYCDETVLNFLLPAMIR